MIHKSFLGVFNKYFLGNGRCRQILTAVFCLNPTFPQLFGGNIILKNRKDAAKRNRLFCDYAKQYASEKQDWGRFQKSRIPVDNSEFSTLSTSLSTGVFHNDRRLWIFIAGFT